MRRASTNALPLEGYWGKFVLDHEKHLKLTFSEQTVELIMAGEEAFDCEIPEEEVTANISAVGKVTGSAFCMKQIHGRIDSHHFRIADTEIHFHRPDYAYFSKGVGMEDGIYFCQ